MFFVGRSMVKFSVLQTSILALFTLGILPGFGGGWIPPSYGDTLVRQQQGTFQGGFRIGDRLEIEREGNWRLGQVTGTRLVNGVTVYDVRYLDVGFVETGVVGDRLRALGVSRQDSPISSSPQTPPKSAYVTAAAIDPNKPVYVEYNGAWWEARILYGRVSGAGGRYTVKLRKDGTVLENVPSSRLRSIEAAQAEGIASNSHDLSTQAGINEILAAHNQWRSQVGVAPLEWSDELAAYAQEWAETLAQRQRMQHRPDNPYGENISQGMNAYLSATRAVSLWGEEIKDYDYETNSCIVGAICGHYTQLVWAESEKIGCGMVRKDNGWEIWVCNYDPPGNYQGERPY